MAEAVRLVRNYYTPVSKGDLRAGVRLTKLSEDD
jgi:hypothetical protein